MEITPILPIAGQKFPRYLEVYLEIFRGVSKPICICPTISRGYSAEPTWGNTGQDDSRKGIFMYSELGFGLLLKTRKIFLFVCKYIEIKSLFLYTLHYFQGDNVHKVTCCMLR